MENNSSSRSCGTVLPDLLLAAFILCKIIGVAPIASWSWWWVLAPGWIPLLIGVAVVAIVLLVQE